MRRQAQKDWFAIARTPTWLGRLLIALALAAVFALLGQWQLGRALPAPSASATPSSTSATPNPSPSKPNPSASPGDGSSQAASDLKTFTVQVDQNNLAIISGRLQPGGKSGFWLVTNSKVLKSSVPNSVGHELTVAWGWAPTFEAAVAAHVTLQSANLGSAGREVSGVLAQSEAPLPSHPTQPFLFDSLSLAQLVNFYQPVQARNTFDEFLIVQPEPGKKATSGLDPIVLTKAAPTPLESVNWLSAFYAIEWSVFAGFAVFMWWRLVEDERLRRQADAEAES